MPASSFIIVVVRLGVHACSAQLVSSHAITAFKSQCMDHSQLTTRPKRGVGDPSAEVYGYAPFLCMGPETLPRKAPQTLEASMPRDLRFAKARICAAMMEEARYLGRARRSARRRRRRRHPKPNILRSKTPKPWKALKPCHAEMADSREKFEASECLHERMMA